MMKLRAVLPVLMVSVLSAPLACADPFAGADAHLSLTADASRADAAQSAVPASWGGESKEEEFADFVSDAGAVLPIAVTATMLLWDDPQTRHAGEITRDAMLYTGLATQALKLAIDSPRPNRPDVKNGFPSGHTSMNFAFARAIAEESDEWGMAAYAWAAGVAWSRVRLGDHDVPQVLAGAALGWWIADEVARDRREPRDRPASENAP